MVDLKRPRHGSMAFRPRKRSATQNVSVFWQDVPDKRIIGFAGYKAGMTHISYVDQTEAPTKGQEVMSAATVIEVPPMYVYGVRCYGSEGSAGDILTSDEKILKFINTKKAKPQTYQPDADKVIEVRLLAFAQPAKTGIGKKHVEKMELGVGGPTPKDKIEYAKTFIGKELKAKDVFKTGEYLDIAAVTKGKGWQGAIKRFGVNRQRRKATGKQRHVGTLGQWHPAYVLYTIPQAGQTGYHKRTEMNKMVMKIGENIDEINPSSGFKNYGFVKSEYLIVKGSVPGPSKRLVKLRLAMRKDGMKEMPLNYVSLDSKR
jgi:large subunit ribosomal protein L3